MTSTSQQHFYPIGTAGVAWGDAEKAQWFAHADVKHRQVFLRASKVNVG
jgi:hypothetical protein